MGAMTNASHHLIGPLNPLERGQPLIVFATGLGAVRSGSPPDTIAPVTAQGNEVEFSVQFAGLAPGHPGLYQVNVLIPGSTPPGQGVSFSIKVSGAISNTSGAVPPMNENQDFSV